MPEGPELHLASRFVNKIVGEHSFTGRVLKSEVSTKNPDVHWDEASYTIFAQSRGKEVKLTLTKCAPGDEKKKAKSFPDTKSLDILFRFGMSGKFTFTTVDEKPKHAHLNFFTASGNMVLSFVDYRRFGRWEVGANWSKDRGPCVLQEYPEFRQHVMSSLDNVAFNKPICEIMLNQKFFNGIGNYLRAEILYRLKIPPFVSAKSILEKLATVDDPGGDNAGDNARIKSEEPDLLQLCNILPLEVINLGGKGYDPEKKEDDYSEFRNWLRCYYNPEMSNLVDHNGRTIWFTGPAGPMMPKDSKARGKKRTSKDSSPPKKLKIKNMKNEESSNPTAKPEKNTSSSTPKLKIKPTKISTGHNGSIRSSSTPDPHVTRNKLAARRRGKTSPYFSTHRQRGSRKTEMDSPKIQREGLRRSNRNKQAICEH